MLESEQQRGATIDKLTLTLEFMAHPGERVRREACYSFVRIIVRYHPAAQEEDDGTARHRKPEVYV
jgi:hypothetical protein